MPASCLPGQNHKAQIRTNSARRLPHFSSKNRSHHRGSDHSNHSEHQQPALGHVRPHSAARRHGPVLHLQASIRSDQALRHGRQARLRRHHALRPQGRQGRHVLLPVARDGHLGPGGHGQRCGHGHGPRGGRSGLALLALGRGLLRHGNHLRRSRARADLSHEGRAGPRARRSRLLHHARHGREVASACGLLLDRNHHCAGLHRQHGAVQLHRARHADRLQRAGRRLGRRVRGARGPRLLRRKS